MIDYNCHNKEQVVKVIFGHKAASPPHINGSAVFARWRQCAPHILKPKMVAMTTSLSTAGPHLTYDSNGSSEAKNQMAS